MGYDDRKTPNPKEKSVYNLIAILLVVVGSYMVIDGLAKRKK